MNITQKYYARTSEEVIRLFNSSEHGLTTEETSRRVKEYGKNVLPEAKTDSILSIFLSQFQSPLIYLLFAASIVVFFAGETTDALIVLGVVLVNSIIGSIQEGRAQNALLALKKLTETDATILRDGKEVVLSAKEIVPGDVVVLREGEKVPADARILSVNQFLVNESALTGESTPVDKISDKIEGEADVETADQKNMVFKGTYVLGGNCTAIVVATGENTVIGVISKEIAKIDTEIPLKAEIKRFSKSIIIAVAVTVVALFVLGISIGLPMDDTLAMVVSLAVSIIPEGLPVVLTVVLATGVWRMSKRNALVRRLQAVEALGQTKVIAVDKTGTITNNEMVTEDVYVSGRMYKVHGVGYEPKGKVTFGRQVFNAENSRALALIGRMCALASKAHVAYLETEKRYKVTGDPTEAAMSVFAEKIHIDKIALEISMPRLAEIPFSSLSKYQAFAHKSEGEYEVMVIGAPEILVERATHFLEEDTVSRLTHVRKEEILQKISELSSAGKRVVAFARKTTVHASLVDKDIAELTFVGLMAMRDTLRVGVSDSILQAKNAGIRVVMITGDHILTATSIAREAKIYTEGDRVVLGTEIEKMSDAELKEALANTTVFARVSPEHKLRIISAYKSRGEIVAMTGDGVNDAPSLVAADLGIAMGKDGTEVAKEASDIVLLDDNFSSIVSAIEEGRGIYKTIKKVIFYLFSTSLGEILTITGAMIVGLPLPLLPGQIIWLNFVTDGFLDVSLAAEPIEKGLLKEKSGATSRNLVDLAMLGRMFVVAIPMAIGALALFSLYLDDGISKALTMSLTTLAAFQWFNAWNARHGDESVFRPKGQMNWYLVGATVVVVCLQLFAVYNPVMQQLLHTTALALTDWIVVILVAFWIIVVEEIRKYFVRAK